MEICNTLLPTVEEFGKDSARVLNADDSTEIETPKLVESGPEEVSESQASSAEVSSSAESTKTSASRSRATPKRS